MIKSLREAIDEYVGPRWRVSEVREGDDAYVVDVDCGSAVVRSRGRSLEEAERRVAGRLWKRLAARKARATEDDLEAMLTKSLEQRARRLEERGEARWHPLVRLVPDPAAPGFAAEAAKSANDGRDEEGEEEPRA